VGQKGNATYLKFYPQLFSPELQWVAREVIVMIVLVEVVMVVAEELVSGMGPTTASFLRLKESVTYVAI
jgi:hypothetical protein